MIKGLVAAGAVIGTTAAAALGIAAPSRADSPTASTAPPPPRAGGYNGTTSQGLRLSLRVTSTRTMLSSARFGFRVHCTDHRTLAFVVSPIVASQPWRLNSSGGTGFTRAFHDTSGERYWIRGRFGDHGTVSGTLSTSWHSPHHGLCRSGRLHWHARLAR